MKTVKYLSLIKAQNYNEKVKVNVIVTVFLTPTSEYLWFGENGEYTERAKKILDNMIMKELGKSEDLVGVCV